MKIYCAYIKGAGHSGEKLTWRSWQDGGRVEWDKSGNFVVKLQIRDKFAGVNVRLSESDCAVVRRQLLCFGQQLVGVFCRAIKSWEVLTIQVPSTNSTRNSSCCAHLWPFPSHSNHRLSRNTKPATLFTLNSFGQRSTPHSFRPSQTLNVLEVININSSISSLTLMRR